MLTEMLGKGGRVCQPASEGKIRCPLNVRPTSEDVITGQLFQALRALSPRWWLPQMLNHALGACRFRQQVFRGLQIDLWQNKPRYPRELLPWDEGSTQVDAVIRWQNPQTTIYFEMKYGSDLSSGTAGNNGRQLYPADQLIRNIRVGLLECGYFDRGQLFETKPRDFAVIVLGARKGHELVARYREPANLVAGIPHSDRLHRLPSWPFVGELDYADVVHLLKQQRRWFTRPERVLAEQLAEYLDFKLTLTPARRFADQLSRRVAALDESASRCASP